MTHIKPLSRRTVTGGIAAALAAIPSVGLCNGVETDALERINITPASLRRRCAIATGSTWRAAAMRRLRQA